MTTYAVTGATGKLGNLAVHSLLERGARPADVVALVRDPAKAADLSAAGVDVRVGDYDAPETLTTALAGVDRLLLVSSPTVGQRAAQHRAVIDAATAAGVQRIAYTSLAKADTNSMPLGTEHRETETLLAQADFPETVVLRNGWYLENYTEQLDQYRATGTIVGATGGATISAATRKEYADAAAAVLLADTVEKKVYELGGPASTLPELATLIGDAAGIPLTHTEVSLDAYRAGLIEAGLPDDVAGFVTDLEAGIAAGDLDVPTADLEALLGRPVTSTKESLAALLG